MGKSGGGANPMLVDLRRLRSERGATLVVQCRESVPSHIVEIPFDEPVEGDLTLTNLGSVLRVAGHLGTHVELICDRCARPFRYRLEAGVHEEFEWGSPDPLLVTASGSLALDLTGLAREELVLALPMVVHCDENCEGLCARCGAERLDGRCLCPETVTDLMDVMKEAP
ncbi:MAG: DUF177 domain-containing protein [Armatimonadetes bacterium]|nr:DUF177 domain-containing protein [Armatimonadota bacterium]